MTRSSLPFGMRWSNVCQRRRLGWSDWFDDGLYLVTGFFL